jgi:ubiquinone/menaquinone biosynthesis C-methylase UbiE
MSRTTLRMLPLLAAIAGLVAVAVRASKAPVPQAGTPVETPAPVAVPDYETITPSPGGTGKVFMGREIAQVMGHQGITWLERNEREAEEAPSRLIEALRLAPDAVIADIGAGSGYHALRIAPKVPQGRVVAVDIQREMLDFVTARAAEQGISNISVHLGRIDDVKLPADSLDAALMVDAYHEFSHPREMLASLLRALKPGGRVFLTEFRAEDPRVPIKPLHKMTAEQARREFEACGFRFLENRRHLPWQHLLVFGKPE